MLDPEFDNQKSPRHVYTLRSQTINLVFLAFVTSTVSCLFGFSPYSRCPYTCAVCRANKVDYHFVGFRWSSQEITDCSRWYTENVEPSHTHAWIGCTYCRRFGIPGLGGGYGCFIGGPLTGLSRTVQMTIYQHFDDRLEAKRLFVHLGQMDAESARLWEALMGWVDKEYPGTWHDWWEQRLAAGK